jgi:hypothetical protein
MTSADSLSLILRRLDEIERSLTAYGRATGSYCHRLFGAQGQSSKGGLNTGFFGHIPSSLRLFEHRQLRRKAHLKSRPSRW